MCILFVFFLCLFFSEVVEYVVQHFSARRPFESAFKACNSSNISACISVELGLNQWFVFVVCGWVFFRGVDVIITMIIILTLSMINMFCFNHTFSTNGIHVYTLIVSGLCTFIQIHPYDYHSWSVVFLYIGSVVSLRSIAVINGSDISLACVCRCVWVYNCVWVWYVWVYV